MTNDIPPRVPDDWFVGFQRGLAARAAHRVHTSGELVRMLRTAGFAEVELRGAEGDRTSSGRPS